MGQTACLGRSAPGKISISSHILELPQVRCKKNPFLVRRLSEQVEYKSAPQGTTPKSPSEDSEGKEDYKPKMLHLKKRELKTQLDTKKCDSLFKTKMLFKKHSTELPKKILDHRKW